MSLFKNAPGFNWLQPLHTKYLLRKDASAEFPEPINNI